MAQSQASQFSRWRGTQQRIARQLLQSLTSYGPSLTVAEGDVISAFNQTCAYECTVGGTTAGGLSSAAAPTLSFTDNATVFVKLSILQMLRGLNNGGSNL